MGSCFDSNFKIGVLGGGQLGRMLVSETQKLGIQTYILDPSDNPPCRSVGKMFKGDFRDFDAVYRFGKEVDLLTIEIEDVNIAALELLEEEGLQIFPKPQTIRTIQNKCLQKQFYQQHRMPTSQFQTFQNIAALHETVSNFGKEHFPFVWKSGLGGYDGKGVSVINNLEELEELPDGPCLIEDFTNFEKELAIIVARNQKGETTTYPLIEMEFNDRANLVEYVYSPASVDAKVAEKAKVIAEDLAGKLDLVGVLAVELFYLKDGSILVNECAPRPHNSGHFTIEANHTSQYQQHLRAILNLPLGNTDLLIDAVMINLIGAEGYQGAVHYEGIEKAFQIPNVYPHIYGKKETRPYRKMGHVTITHESLQEAKRIAKELKETIIVKTKSK